MNNIAVLDYRLTPYIQVYIQALANNEIIFPTDRCPESERITRTGDADIALVTVWDKIDAEYLEACSNLKYIGICGTATANVDLKELAKRGITYSNIPSHSKEHVAEYYFMQLVSLMRGAGKYQWKQGEAHEILGKNIGIIGLGQVGKAIAHLALAYKMNVSYFSPHRKTDWEDLGVKYLEMDGLLSNCEVIAICSPPNVKVLDESKFKSIKNGSILMQVSFGSPFDQLIFMNWVARDGNYAIFDMSAGEDNYQAYKDLPRIIFPAVVAGDTYESNHRRGARAVENLKKFIDI